MRFPMIPLLGAALLTGCGMKESDFIVQYTTTLCEQVMECSDQAELTFDGILDAQDCYDVKIEEVADWGVGCSFKGVKAEDCLADMALLTCPPAAGDLPERPASCDVIYVRCSTTEVVEDTTETTEDPVDTDPPEDTDGA